MKKIYILLCLVVISVTHSKSQEMMTTADDLSPFLASTLYVPVTGNVAFDSALQKAFSQYWKITPYKLLEYKEYGKLVKENEKQKKSEPQPKSFLFTWSSNMFRIPDICLAYTFEYGTESLIESHWIDATDVFAKSKKFDYVKYRMEYIVKGMNDIITYTRDHKLGAGNSKQAFLEVAPQIINHINTNSKSIKDKTLILNKDRKNGFDYIYKPKEFAKYYPYPYKFVSEAEFDKILKGEQKEYVCFITTYANISKHAHDASSVRSISERVQVDEFVYEPSTRSMIYMDTRIVQRVHGVKKEEIEQLIKAITQ